LLEYNTLKEHKRPAYESGAVYALIPVWREFKFERLAAGELKIQQVRRGQAR